MSKKSAIVRPVMPASANKPNKVNPRIARRNASSVVVGNTKGAKLGRKR